MAESYQGLFKNVQAKLKAYSDFQPPELQFGVFSDRFRELPATAGDANVFLYMPSMISPTQMTSNGHIEYESTINIDLEIRQRGEKSGLGYVEATELAAERLRGFVLQIMDALFATDERTLGLRLGAVSTKNLESVSMLTPDEIGERAVMAARMTLRVGLEWTPEPLSGDMLEAISVTARLFSQVVKE